VIGTFGQQLWTPCRHYASFVSDRAVSFAADRAVRLKPVSRRGSINRKAATGYQIGRRQKLSRPRMDKAGALQIGHYI